MTRRILLRALLFVLASAPVIARAAYTPRFAHTATGLPSGNVLVAGGINAAGAPVATVEIVQTSRDGSVIDGGSMSVARASHTATILPDGRVLVTGGWGGGAVVRNTAELYDPVTNSWSATGNTMGTARFNHTATLLNDGRVLVCGGQTDFTPTVTPNCEIFCTATTQTGCGGGAFQFVAAPANLQAARALHTATLLKDGKVWFAGGWNGASYMSTTERFDPSLGLFNSAAPLTQARAYHTATLMGHGKVLIAGGFNGDNATVNGNSFGILRTAETYDPVANNVIPAASMNARREMQSAVLTAEDVVLLEGGLGNVTTTYLSTEMRQNFEVGSLVTHSFAGFSLPRTGVAGGNATLPVSFYLGTPIAGRIEDGEIWHSTPQVHVSGVADTYFVPASESNPAIGLRSSLNGQTVGCDSNGNCGFIQRTLTFQNYSGVTTFVPRAVSNTTPLPPVVTAGLLDWTSAGPGNGIGVAPAAPSGNIINTSTMQVTVTFDMPLALVGSTISSGTFQLVSPGGTGSVFKVSSFTATLVSAWATFAGQTISLNSQGTSGVVSLTLSLSGLTGTVIPDGAATDVRPPQSLAVNTSLTGLSGTARLATNQLYIENQGFFVDISTVVVRRMVLSSPAYYDPKLNQWTNVRPGRTVEDVSYGTRGRFGASSTLLNNNDVLTIGGRECDDGSATCAGFLPKVTGGLRQDYVEYSAFKNWSSVSTTLDPPGTAGGPRVFHTATNLPSGKILVAGGSNGPNVLRTAVIWDPTDPAGETVRLTSRPMHDVRDLHSATLLPNGRVLLAGGFSTNATSTGSTAASEIYYPDTDLFLRAGSMATPRSNHVATLLPDGNVLVAGGFGPNDIITATAEIFYSTGMAWRSAASMSTPRSLCTATTLKDGRVMVAGGINAGGPLSSVEAYNPATGAWAALAAMPSALHSHTATLLLDGRVLVAGGNNGLGEVDASYVYDPSGNSWSATPLPSFRSTILQQPRFGHNAVALPNGDVVISGGVERFGNVTEQIEYFHITANVWISSGVTFGSLVNQVRPRAYHTMTLASNNYLYAIGGSDGAIGGQGTSLYSTVERAYFTSDPDNHMPNPPTPFASPRQSTILATSTTPFLPNTLFTVTGQQFRGGTEASGGGAASANSSFSLPRLVLSQIEGSGGPGSQSNAGFNVDLTTQIYANPGNLNTLNSSVTVLLPATNLRMPYGWYHARVGANDIYSNPVAVQAGPAKPLTAPGSFASTPLGTSSMSWTWSAVAGVDGYNVYQTTTGVLISTTGTPSFFQTGLAPNTTASILVAGYTLSGDGPLGFGATNYTLASTATSVSIASVTFSDLLLKWNPNGNEGGTIYEISQSTDNFVGSFSTPVPNILGLTANQVTIGNLLSATTYYFRVRAYNGAGLPGGFSATVSTLTRTSLASVDGTPVSSSQIDWAWQNPGGVVNFRVYNATTGVLLATPGSLATGFSDTGLAVNSRRSILVSVVTAAGEGPLTPSATHFTLANVPLAGTPHISPISIGSFTVNWAINGNPSYTDYRTVLLDGISTSPVYNDLVTGPAIARTFGGLLPGTLYISSVAAVNGEGIVSAWLVGSTYTLAQPARNVTVLNTTPVSIYASWDTQQNGPAVQWEVLYSTDNFVLHQATAVPFSSLFTGNVTTITGLATGTTYWIKVTGRTPFGTPTAPAAVVSTITFNGGAAAGSLAGELLATAPSQLFGSLGNGRQIDVRSPAGAFPSNVFMTISSYNVAGTLCPGGVNVAVSITNRPALQPLKPVFLTLSYGAGEVAGIPASRLVLFRYEPLSGTCVPLETVADASTVRAQINHFSLFQLGQVTLATDVGTARVFPNPFRTATDSYVTIDRVPAASRVRIFTLRGELVADVAANGSGIATWAGTNPAGRSVASGLYLVVLENGSNKKILKLSLLR